MSDETHSPRIDVNRESADTMAESNAATVDGASADPQATGAFDPEADPRTAAATVEVTAAIAPEATYTRDGHDDSIVNLKSEASGATGAFGAIEGATCDHAPGDPGATGAFGATEGATCDYAPGATGAFGETEGATCDYDPGVTEGRRPTDPMTTEAMPESRPRKGGGASVPPQQQCGEYLLKRFFAKGGMGEVWLAEDPAIGRAVALKRMLGKRADQAARFRIEAQVTGQLEHPGIVPVHHLGTNAHGEPFYVMKFVQGRTLQKVLEEFHAQRLSGGAYEVEQLRMLQMFLSLCQTVAYAHSRGVLHRDLKPENVMLGPYGETILLDWGIAKILGGDDPKRSDESDIPNRLRADTVESETQDSAIMGTPAYMAPEAAAGLNEQVNERSDIFLLGATLYQMLAGVQPRTARTMRELLKKAREERPRPIRSINPNVPKALDAICMKAMAHDQADRYQAATELADDIQRFIAGEPVTAYREGLAARAWRWAKRHRTALLRSAAVVFIVAAATFAGMKIREVERQRAWLAREAAVLKAQDEARVALKAFRHLADEASYFAATTNPASEHAPYFDPRKGAELSRAALAMAEPWGDELDAFPLAEERPALRSELHNLLILDASEALRTDPGPETARRAIAELDRDGRLGVASASDYRLLAIALEQLGETKKADEMRRRAEDPSTPKTALDLFLLGERERDESSARVGDDTSDRKPWQLDPDRMRRAIGFYRQALAADPNHYWARLQLGRCLQSLGRYAEAAEALGACIAIHPSAPWGYSALGLALAEQGRYDEARRVLDRAIKIDPEARLPRLHRGVVNWRQKQDEAALDDFEAVLAPPIEKRLVEAAYYRGQLHLERGEVPQALDDFNLVAEASPGFRSVYLDRPLIYLSQNDPAHALADLDRYIALVRPIDPDGWEIHGLRGRLLRFLFSELPPEKRRGPTGQASLKLAREELVKALQKGGNAAGLYDDLGAILEHSGRLDLAIGIYGKGIAMAPGFAKLRIKRGWAWEMRGQHDRALDDFAAAAKVEPDNAEAHTGLGYVQAMRKLPSDAQREADLSLLHGSDEYLVLHNVACIYAALSQSDAAHADAYQDVSMALLRRAVELWKKASDGPNELDLIKAEPAFTPIRGRKDYQALIQDPGHAA